MCSKHAPRHQQQQTPSKLLGPSPFLFFLSSFFGYCFVFFLYLLREKIFEKFGFCLAICCCCCCAGQLPKNVKLLTVFFASFCFVFCFFFAILWLCWPPYDDVCGRNMVSALWQLHSPAKQSQTTLWPCGRTR